MSKNCHARSKQKRKKLRLKNLLLSIHLKRIAKKMKAMLPKGKTIKNVEAKEVAPHVNSFAPKGFDGFFSFGNAFDHGHALRLNQRQKRKRARAANRLVK